MNKVNVTSKTLDIKPTPYSEVIRVIDRETNVALYITKQNGVVVSTVAVLLPPKHS